MPNEGRQRRGSVAPLLVVPAGVNGTIAVAATVFQTWKKM